MEASTITSPSKEVQKERYFPGRSKFLLKWLGFCKFNQFFEEVDIIPFKCPMQKKLELHLKKEETFCFQDVYNFSVASGKPITDVIDLTDTNRYYEPNQESFFPPNVQHHKFRISGKRIPKRLFLNTILDKMEALINEKKVIGIHCLHGVNRTGFIVCTFLVERLGWDPAAAIIAFKKARGEEITHLEYLEEILGLSCELMEETASGGLKENPISETSKQEEELPSEK